MAAAVCAVTLCVSSSAWGASNAADTTEHALELSAGASALLVLGPVSSTSTVALDTTVDGCIAGAFWWAGGVRLAASPVQPEAFGRLVVAPGDAHWRPSAGLELGLSGIAAHDSGDALLADARAQSRDGLVPLYVAVHAAPLSFEVFGRFRVSFAEMSFGTHVAPFGRYVRLSLGLLSFGGRL